MSAHITPPAPQAAFAARSSGRRPDVATGAISGTSPASATGPPGDDPGPPAFASVLNSQVARTALAEGQKSTGQTSGARRDGRGQDSHSALRTPGNSTGGAVAVIISALQAAAGTPVSAGALASDTAAAQGPSGTPASGNPVGSAASAALLSTAASGTPASAAVLTGGAGTPATPGAVPTAQVLATTIGTATATGTPEPVAATPVSAQAPAGTQAAESLPASTVATGTSSATSAPGSQAEVAQTTTDAPSSTASPSTAATPPPIAPQQTAGSAGQPLSPQPDPGSAGPQGLSSSPAAATPVTAPATAAPQPADTAKATVSASSLHAATGDGGAPSDAGAAQTATTTDPSTPIAAQPLTQPSTPAAPASTAAASAGGGVPLAHAIETVRMTIEMAANRGYSQMRLDLSPPELGSIRIHLHQTADGLVARVVAEQGAAAQTLQQGGHDLRRSLEQAGLPLLRLDIEASGQQAPQGREPQLPGAAGSREDIASTDEQNGSQLDESGATEVQLGNGATVNVLA